MNLDQYISPMDRERLRREFQQAEPYPHICIDNFLQPDFASQVLGSIPAYKEAMKQGVSHKTANENGKVQLTDAKTFDKPVAQLNRVLASSLFLEGLSYISGIPKLLADEELVGGGIHQTGPRGRLDVHIDFNYMEERQLHRRMNILIYFNKGWQEGWGGDVEIWDLKVKKCHYSFSPIFNRCVIFETNDISYHGVTAVHCPQGESRKSFAAYYYTKEAPGHWTGRKHSTIFKARPDEKLKAYVTMPIEKVQRKLKKNIRKLKSVLKG